MNNLQIPRDVMSLLFPNELAYTSGVARDSIRDLGDAYLLSLPEALLRNLGCYLFQP